MKRSAIEDGFCHADIIPEYATLLPGYGLFGTNDSENFPMDVLYNVLISLSKKLFLESLSKGLGHPALRQAQGERGILSGAVSFGHVPRPRDGGSCGASPVAFDSCTRAKLLARSGAPRATHHPSHLATDGIDFPAHTK